MPSTTIYVRPSRRIVGIFFYVEHSVANDEHEPKHCSRHVINKEYADPLKRYIERILFHLGPLMVGLFEGVQQIEKRKGEGMGKGVWSQGVLFPSAFTA